MAYRTEPAGKRVIGQNMLIKDRLNTDGSWCSGGLILVSMLFELGIICKAVFVINGLFEGQE